MVWIPEEARGLPPPRLFNTNSAWCGFMGWCTAILGNALNRRPPLLSGVHRQALGITIGWFIGYHLTRHDNYTFAKLDRDLFEYMKLHPEDFKKKDKRTMGEVLEDFHPIR
ncbi:NADH dehydrogenase [ubiquinone] 1 subunit C2 [Ambystoma mexicanum]|uniref:NADH dehydrogenase [ubiquinone] 1 subunit C2 n=1 Tax=Ambystoma mexicanum TaxID=8296 RepID=UPI0037E8CE78